MTRKALRRRPLAASRCGSILITRCQLPIQMLQLNNVECRVDEVEMLLDHPQINDEDDGTVPVYPRPHTEQPINVSAY